LDIVNPTELERTHRCQE